jgi:hypothetical protein
VSGEFHAVTPLVPEILLCAHWIRGWTDPTERLDLVADF